jgi:phosphatidylglycerophosphate synthase
MIDYNLRPLNDRLLAPLLPALGRITSPNGLSVMAFLVGIACSAAIFFGSAEGSSSEGSSSVPILAFVLWLLNRLLDGLDGALARFLGEDSDRGGYLDIVLDFAIYASVPLAMIFASPDLRLARAGAILLAAFYINSVSWMYLSALLEKRRAVRETENGGTEDGVAKPATSILMPRGLVEGTETIVFYSLMILLPGFRTLLFLLCGGATLLGAGVRFFQGLKMLSLDPALRDRP